MKLLSGLVAVLLTAVLLSSCKKGDDKSEDEASAADIAKAEEFKTFVKDKQFQVREYYSDTPIDYNKDDGETTLETDLWPYVSLWIKDDQNLFDVAANQVTITQNNDKMPGLADATIVRPISIGADKTGAYFNFLNYQYNPLKYHLVEFTSNYFIVYADWTDGAKVFTKFAVLP